jgi:AcrR family transcriptional regulator
LVEAARYLFWERGYAGTSMADLLDRSDVNSGSFYHFFESKEALLREVLRGYLDGLRPVVVNPALASTDDPLGRVMAILAGYRERILQTDCKYGCPLGRLALEVDPENRPAHQLIAENFSGWIGAVRECVEQMKLPAGTDTKSLATYVLAVMEGGVMLARTYRSVEPFDRVVNQLHEHFRVLTRGQR